VKKIITILIFLCVCLSAYTQDLSRKERLIRHVEYLASDELNGRKAGSIYAEVAASYIEDELNGIGLKPFFTSGPAHRFNKNGVPLNDVVFKLEGNDPVLKHQYIVIGAHYDHLGVKQGKIYNGADDNASGTAAVIEVARTLKKEQSKLRRSIIIAAFDGEEEGLFGSYELAEKLADTLGVENIALMMSLDMVGWYSTGGSLKLEGASTIMDGEILLQEIAKKEDIIIQTKHFEHSLFTATDTQGFAENKIPTLAVTTGLKSPYHKPEDDADLIDYEGLDKVCSYISELLVRISSSLEYKPSGKVAPKHNKSERVFELGLTGSLGTRYLLFNECAVRTSKKRFYWNGGIIAQVNLKGTAIQTGVQYESISCTLPTSVDIYGKGILMNQDALTVPLVFMARGGDYVNAYAGFGGYYSRVLKGEFVDPNIDWTIKPNQYGLSLKFGVGLGRFNISAELRRELGVPFYGTYAPKAYIMGSFFTLSYLFF